MSGRFFMQEASGEPLPTNLVLRTRPNWTAVWFFAALASLHLTMWATAAAHSRPEGYMSLIFGGIFALCATAAYLTTFEMAVIPSERRVRLRTGYRRLRVERSVAFTDVQGVRLTLADDPDHRAGRIELLCRNEAITCPPTAVARVEALCLALTIGVRLIKVLDGDTAPVEPSRPARAERAGAADELPLN